MVAAFQKIATTPLVRTIASTPLVRTSTFILQKEKYGLWLPRIQALLYDTYVHEQKWVFGKENPSFLRVKTNKDKMKLLEDRFMKSSTWVIAVENTDRGDEGAELMGVFRLIENKPVEVAGYAHQPQADAVHKLLNEYGPEGLVEVNRFAVSSKYRSRGVGGSLMHTLFEYIADKGDSDDRPVVATIPVNIGKHHPNIWFEVMKPLGKPFFYEATDPLPAQMYLGHREAMADTVEKYCKTLFT